MHDFDGHYWGMGWGWIIGLIFMIAIIWWIARNMNTGNRNAVAPDKTPLDILKKRYARGEIDKQEFETRKHDLQ